MKCYVVSLTAKPHIHWFAFAVIGCIQSTPLLKIKYLSCIYIMNFIPIYIRLINIFKNTNDMFPIILKVDTLTNISKRV